MIHTLALVATPLILAVIVYATLSPARLRPRTGYVSFEREAAFALLATAMTVAFPSYFWWAVAAAIGIAVGLELAQNLTPDRHGRAIDALQKVAGVVVGCSIGYLINRFAAF